MSLLVTSMFTVAVAQPLALQSVYTKRSVPTKPVFGVYSIVPSGFTTAVPFCGAVTTLGVVAPLGVSLANTLIVTGVLRAVSTLSSAAIGTTVGVGVGVGAGGITTTTEATPQATGVSIVHTR